jgi:uncharacterized membrane protein
LQAIKSKQNIKTIPANNEYTVGLHRLVNFSDSIFAFAMTLLALSVKLSDISKDSISKLLSREIINLAPEFGFYAFCFLIIGSLWMTHHKIFQSIERYDDAFIFLNIISLMFIAAVPIPTGIMGQYIMYRPSLILYATYMTVTTLFLSLVRFYAIYKKLTESSMPVLYYSVRSLIAPVVFLFSIPLIIFLGGYLAFSWLLIFIFEQLWKRIYFSKHPIVV